MMTNDPCQRGYRTTLAYSFDAPAVTPRDGERLTFGVHRERGADRVCAAWPANPDASRHAAYLRWIRGAPREI